MKRRTFLIGGTFAASGMALYNSVPSYARNILANDSTIKEDVLYNIFRDPDVKCRPYVRWWWNGDKIEKAELARELKVLKSVGIGGVEIYPVGFPFPNMTDDMGIKSLAWLSDEWIDLLQFTFKKAESLNMDCSLIADTGFPFGGEFLEDGDRTQVAVIGVIKMEGPLSKEFSLFDLYKEADPEIYSPYSGRTLEMLSVKLVSDPLNSMESVVDLSGQIKDGFIKVSVPEGKFALYALVKVEGFQKVIVGAPGGDGSVLNHFSKEAVQKYLNRISEKIEKKIGPLPSNFTSFFVDSMELEGANWTSDMLDEFKKRRGYDIFPYLPFILFKIGRMGNNIVNPNYTVQIGSDLNAMLVRIKYDWALTSAEIFRQSFVETFAQWCRDNKVKSRVQAYGRGYFLLEGSFPVDIPECETWLTYGLGKDIPENEYIKYPWHLGQGYTMINKYVSSAAHLKGKRTISSEELTNTNMVFNESLELFKIAGDQSTISGVTRPVFQGFNYSPPDAPFPGWIRWGGYSNEKNTIWPYFSLYVDYRARLSALLQQGTLYADIALLAPIPDMWGEFGAQNEPFPQIVYPNYQMLIWESIHENGNGCDYVSEQVINDAVMHNGFMNYEDRRYHTIFLIEVRGIDPATVKKLYDFISRGGRIFCIEAYPDHYPGWYKHTERDEEVKSWVDKMKRYTDRFILIRKPNENFCEWFAIVQEKYKLSPYVKIDEPRRYITQVRYQMADTEVFFFINSSDSHDYILEAAFSPSITHKNQAWLWNAITGERFKLRLDNNKLSMALGPATSAIIVFNKDKEGSYLQPTPLDGGTNTINLSNVWDVQLQHYDGHIENTKMATLTDLKEIPKYPHFAGTIKYKSVFFIDESQKIKFLNLGKVYGISIVTVNGKDAGIKWFGNRIYSIDGLLQEGNNTIEIWVVTVMVNYMKTLKDNKIAQYWTNEGAKDQPLQSLGLVGPVRVY